MLLTVYYTGLVTVLIYSLVKLAIPKTRKRARDKFVSKGLYFNFTTVGCIVTLQALLWPVLFLANILLDKESDDN